jgi:hypothetical protein
MFCATTVTDCGAGGGGGGGGGGGNVRVAVAAGAFVGSGCGSVVAVGSATAVPVASTVACPVGVADAAVLVTSRSCVAEGSPAALSLPPPQAAPNAAIARTAAPITTLRTFMLRLLPLLSV